MWLGLQFRRLLEADQRQQFNFALFCRGKASLQIQEDKSTLKLFDEQLSKPNRSHGTFFLNLHKIGYTVFLILYLIKISRIHEDSNFHIKEGRIIKSVSAYDVTHCVTEIHYLEDSVLEM